MHRAPRNVSGYLPAVKFGRQLIRVRIDALARRLRKIPTDWTEGRFRRR